MAKPVLGRGLSALLGAAGSPARPAENVFQAPPPPAAIEAGEQVRRAPVAQVRPCPLQPRKDFSQESLRELADSIKEQGIVQPLIVRPRGDGYEIIAGERRWRAAQMAGLAEVPVIVRQADDRAVLEMALIENLQRENLNAIEEAQGYAQLIEQFQLTQEQAALKVGKSRAVVANALRLLKLTPKLQTFVRDGRLSVGHAKVILGLASAEEQDLAADRVLKKSLSVRQTEELAAALQKKQGQKNGGRNTARFSGTGRPRCGGAEQNPGTFWHQGGSPLPSRTRRGGNQNFQRRRPGTNFESGGHRNGLIPRSKEASARNMNIQQVRAQCAQTLLAEQERAARMSAFVGLDGFVDEILHVVDKRENAEVYQRLPTIAQLGARLSAAAGKSTNLELVNQITKLGGNGPIMANALASFGLKVTYLGVLGYPNLHPVFLEFAQRAEVHSIADPGTTDALEFEDGKIMVGKHASLKQVTWKNIQERFGRDRFAEKFGSANLVGFVNWTMLPYMSDLWDSILKEICPAMKGPRRTIFFDLADPEKRTREDILRALDLIGKFEEYFDVILGLNEKEAHEIGEVFGLKPAAATPEALADLGIAFGETLKIGYHRHPSRHLCAGGQPGRSRVVHGPFTPKPLITTGRRRSFQFGFLPGAVARVRQPDERLDRRDHERLLRAHGPKPVHGPDRGHDDRKSRAYVHDPGSCQVRPPGFAAKRGARWKRSRRKSRSSSRICSKPCTRPRVSVWPPNRSGALCS